MNRAEGTGRPATSTLTRQSRASGNAAVAATAAVERMAPNPVAPTMIVNKAAPEAAPATKVEAPVVPEVTSEAIAGL